MKNEDVIREFVKGTTHYGNLTMPLAIAYEYANNDEGRFSEKNIITFLYSYGTPIAIRKEGFTMPFIYMIDEKISTATTRHQNQLKEIAGNMTRYTPTVLDLDNFTDILRSYFLPMGKLQKVCAKCGKTTELYWRKAGFYLCDVCINLVLCD